MKQILILTLCILSQPFALNAKETVGEKTGKMIDQTIEKKEQVQKDLEKSLEQLSQDIQALKHKVASSTGQAKDSLNEKINSLDQERAKVDAQLQQFKNSSGKAWDDMKIGLTKSLDELKLAYEKAKKNFKK